MIIVIINLADCRASRFFVSGIIDNFEDYSGKDAAISKVIISFNADNMITIDDFRQGEEHQISDLISRVFNEFVAPDYSAGGVAFFNDFIEPAKFPERLLKGDFILTAKDGDKIIGMIEIRDNNHISLLFVDKTYHRRMIAKNLYQEALMRCRGIDPELSVFYVHASPYSIPAYHKLGFAAMGGMKEEHGIFYLPMVMMLQSWPAGR